MPLSPEPPFESTQQGISLDELAAAFAQVMDQGPRQRASTELPPAATVEQSMSDVAPVDVGPAAEAASQLPTEVIAEKAEESDLADDDACPISPRGILEAMLFVGNRENRPLTSARAAELMRGVQPDEVPDLVEELNRRYSADGCPYEIVGEGNGYRLALRRDFHPLRSRFFARVREARLSQAAIDVLAIVAYQQPITSQKIRQLRSKPSSHILAHLVRRGLLRIERPDPKLRTPHYCTTDRFLRLFNLRSLEDLPQSEDLGAL